MKLELDLVRALLLELERCDAGDYLHRKFSAEEAEALIVLEHDDFIDAEFLFDNSGAAADLVVRRLLWKGHELIKDIRDDEVYAEVKTTFLGRVKDMSISVFAQFAAEYTKNLAAG
jgi:hypothetical protein